MNSNIWGEKGATLSVNNAIKEYGIKEVDISDAIKAGKMQYRLNYIHGNPFYKLIRSEVESFVKSKYGNTYLEKHRLIKELDDTNKQLRKHKRQIKVLEKRKSELEAGLSAI